MALLNTLLVVSTGLLVVRSLEGEPSEEEEDCMTAYHRRFDTYWYYSAGRLHTHQRGQAPADLLKEQLTESEVAHLRRDQATLAEWAKMGREVDLLFADSSAKVLGCWGEGGRYWYLSFDGEAEVNLGSSTVCVPYSCTPEQIQTEIAPIFFGKLFRSNGELKMDMIQATELSHWADMEIDFFVIGLDGCGSTSVSRILSRHTEINFTTLSVHSTDEDFFMQDMGRNTLPHMDHVERVRAFRDQVDSQRGMRKIGLYQPSIWTSDELLQAVAHIPNVKVLATLCDPVDRFDRRLHCQSHPTDANYSEAFEFQLADPEAPFAQQMHKWKEMFEDNIMFIYQGALSSRDMWDAVAKFLGIRPYAPNAIFARHNSRGAPPSPLCGRQESIKKIKAMLEPEYEFMSKVFGPIERVQLRQTKCEVAMPKRESCKKAACKT